MRLTFNMVTRLPNSVNGNPRYEFVTDEGTFLSQSDAGWVYITPVAGRTYDVTLTRAGRIAIATEIARN